MRLLASHALLLLHLYVANAAGPGGLGAPGDGRGGAPRGEPRHAEDLAPTKDYMLGEPVTPLAELVDEPAIALATGLPHVSAAARRMEDGALAEEERAAAAARGAPDAALAEVVAAACRGERITLLAMGGSITKGSGLPEVRLRAAVRSLGLQSSYRRARVPPPSMCMK